MRGALYHNLFLRYNLSGQLSANPIQMMLTTGDEGGEYLDNDNSDRCRRIIGKNSQ